MAITNRILDLDSLVDRPVVVLNGQEYWLRTADILPPLDLHRLTSMSRRTTELMALDELSETDERELAAFPGRMCRMVLDAPDDVHESLDDPKRLLIVETAMTTFRSGTRMTPPIAAAPAPAERPIPTGASSSPDSSASTAGTP